MTLIGRGACSTLSALSALCLLVGTSAAGPTSPAPAPADGLTPQQRQTLTGLVARLGAFNYLDRDAAQEELNEFCRPLGARALPALLAGRRSRDAEIATRCSECLRVFLATGPLPDLLADAPAAAAAEAVGAALAGRTDKPARDWFAGDDATYPAAMRRAAAGVLCSFMDGNPEAAVAHCGFPFLRHGNRTDRDQLLAVWQRLSGNWQEVFARLSKVEPFTADAAPPEAEAMTDLPLSRGDRGVVFKFGAAGDPDGGELKLVFVLRASGGKWRAVGLSQ